MSGLDRIPLRIPERWDPRWFEWFVRDVLSLADARNAQAGAGLSIESTPDGPAVISASDDVEELVQASVITVLPSQLDQARQLTAETGVLELVDGGAGNRIEIRIKDVGIPYAKLRPTIGLSVIGAPRDEAIAGLEAITASADNTVLARIDSELRFAPLSLDMFGPVPAPSVLGAAAAVEDGEAPVEALEPTGPGEVLASTDAGGGATELEWTNLSDLLDMLGSAAEGDILYRSASGWALLPRGTDGQVLTLSSGAPAWVDVASLLPQTFVTVDDETVTLQNSRQLVAGDGISLDTSQSGEIAIENLNP